MKTLLNDIAQLDYAVVGTSLKSGDAEECNEVLSIANRPEIPQEVVEFLYKYNGISCGDGDFWGIDCTKHTLFDIVAENLLSHNPDTENILLLGENTVTYVAWNKLTQKYVMLDKTSYETLHQFSNLAETISYILKIIR